MFLENNSNKRYIIIIINTKCYVMVVKDTNADTKVGKLKAKNQNPKHKKIPKRSKKKLC